jgi:hypothetical protein
MICRRAGGPSGNPEPVGSSPGRIQLPSSLSDLSLSRNEERFSLSGAAHEPLREDCVAEFRAGERKTYWTKPPAPTPGLWAFNGPEPIGGARLRGR